MGELGDKIKSEKTCLNRLLGICENDCAWDYGDHFPNNHDCKNYVEAHVLKAQVERGNILEQAKYNISAVYRRTLKFLRIRGNI